jgi:hypothetical protein
MNIYVCKKTFDVDKAFNSKIFKGQIFLAGELNELPFPTIGHDYKNEYWQKIILCEDSFPFTHIMTKIVDLVSHETN